MASSPPNPTHTFETPSQDKKPLSDIFENLNLNSIPYLRRCLILDTNINEQDYSIVYDYNLLNFGHSSKSASGRSSGNRSYNEEGLVYHHHNHNHHHTSSSSSKHRSKQITLDSEFCYYIKESLKYLFSLTRFFGEQEYICTRKKIETNLILSNNLSNNHRHHQGQGHSSSTHSQSRSNQQDLQRLPSEENKKEITELTIFCRPIKDLPWVIVFIADSGFKSDGELVDVSRRMEPTVVDMYEQCKLSMDFY